MADAIRVGVEAWFAFAQARPDGMRLLFGQAAGATSPIAAETTTAIIERIATVTDHFATRGVLPRRRRGLRPRPVRPVRACRRCGRTAHQPRRELTPAGPPQWTRPIDRRAMLDGRLSCFITSCAPARPADRQRRMTTTHARARVLQLRARARVLDDAHQLSSPRITTLLIRKRRLQLRTARTATALRCRPYVPQCVGIRGLCDSGSFEFPADFARMATPASRLLRARSGCRAHG
jgi:hypothetical protein